MKLTPRLARGARPALAVGLAAVLCLSVACGSSNKNNSSGGGTSSAPTLAASASAPASAPSSSAPSGGTFSVGTQSWNIANFLPGGTGDNNIDYAIWTPLTLVDSSGQVQNAVADSITSSDQQTWTIKIKDGWTFQNGEPVTAQSFADSWNSTSYAPNAVAADWQFSIIQGWSDLNPASGKPATQTLSGVKVVDQSTLEVTLTAPNSQFPYVLSQTTWAPVPPEALTDLTAFGKLPIGNGPYQVAAPGITANAQQITLTRYDNYAGAEKGNADTIVVKSFDSSSTAYTAFQGGQVDVTLLDAGTDLASAQSNYPDQFTKVTFPALVFLGFPSWDKRFENPLIREAFSMAIDRDTIISSLLQGFGQNAGGIAPDSVPGSAQDLCGNYCSYDPTQAKALLAQAGGWSGSLTLWTNQDPNQSAVLQAILNQLHTNLGIANIKLQTPAFSDMYSALSSKKVDGPFVLYLGATYPSLYQSVYQLFGNGSGTNTTLYSDPDFDTLMNQAAAASPDQATAIAAQAAQKAMSTLPLTPLYYPVGGLVYAKKLGNVTAEFLGSPHLATITVSS
ncbi:MAG: ABC transporter substrate-binding protein [Actinomycetia bacterium]|nr:ABC transporter substrate-binding protein [Actinomycetes bacterium]